MKITFFEVDDKEIEFFKKELGNEDLLFFSRHLQKEDLEEIRDTEILCVFIYSKITSDVIDALPNLKAIVTRSTGIDHIDTNYANLRNISVYNVSSYGSNTVAEHTFALILNLSRNVHKAFSRTISGNFDIRGLEGFDLYGKTIGVVGTGKIGLHVIRIAKGFGMGVLAYDTYRNDLAKEILDFRYVELEYLLSNSDIITLHVPLTPETYHLINMNNIKMFKRGSILINTSRGSVVETDALIYALENRILSGVGLDVLEGEDLLKEEKEIIKHPEKFKEISQIAKNHVLLSFENVIYTPHIAFYSKEAEERILKTTLENIKKIKQKVN
ncbi:MAG: NAD(P)-dependent oxidoreductase [Candidatus Woesearchaeota archaeon]